MQEFAPFSTFRYIRSNSGRAAVSFAIDVTRDEEKNQFGVEFEVGYLLPGIDNFSRKTFKNEIYARLGDETNKTYWFASTDLKHLTKQVVEHLIQAINQECAANRQVRPEYQWVKPLLRKWLARKVMELANDQPEPAMEAVIATKPPTKNLGNGLETKGVGGRSRQIFR